MSTTADDVQDQTAPPEDRARAIGWRPKEEFKGNPETWVDATEFLRRGEEVLPIMKATNRRLNETVEQQQQRLLELERINRANAKALEELQEAQREQTVERTEQTVEQIEAGIVAAREAGNVQEELALLRRHAEATTKLQTARQKPTERQQQSPPQDMTKTPEFQVFLTENPWFNTDSVMRAASVAIQNDMIESRQITPNMGQAERLKLVAEATRKRFGLADERRPGASKVEGGGGPAGGQGGGGSGKSYADLPSDAKEACDKAAKRLQFGEGKRYKDLAAWRASYVQTYFST